MTPRLPSRVSLRLASPPFPFPRGRPLPFPPVPPRFSSFSPRPFRALLSSLFLLFSLSRLLRVSPFAFSIPFYSYFFAIRCFGVEVRRDPKNFERSAARNPRRTPGSDFHPRPRAPSARLRALSSLRAVLRLSLPRASGVSRYFTYGRNVPDVLSRVYVRVYIYLRFLPLPTLLPPTASFRGLSIRVSRAISCQPPP